MWPVPLSRGSRSAVEAHPRGFGDVGFQLLQLPFSDRRMLKRSAHVPAHAPEARELRDPEEPFEFREFRDPPDDDHEIEPKGVAIGDIELRKRWKRDARWGVYPPMGLLLSLFWMSFSIFRSTASALLPSI